jgi:hypothetical protein
MRWQQYFLVQPGVPVLCAYTEIYQGSGTFIPHLPVHTIGFVKPDKDPRKCTWHYQNQQGQPFRLRAGYEAVDALAPPPYISAVDSSRSRMTIYTAPYKTTGHVEVLKGTLVAAITKRTKAISNTRIVQDPIFFIFSEKELKKESLKDLERVKFRPA